MNQQSLQKLYRVGKVAGTLALASFGVGCSDSKPTPAQSPLADVPLALTEGAKKGGYQLSTIKMGEAGAPKTLGGILNALGSGNAYNEIPAAGEGISAFIIVPGGDWKKVSYPPKTLAVDVGDLVVRVSGTSQANSVALDNAILAAWKQPESVAATKLKSQFAELFNEKKQAALKERQTVLEKEIVKGETELGKYIGHSKLVSVQSGQTLNSLLQSQLPKSAEKLDQSSRIALLKALTEYAQYNSNSDNPNFDAAKIRAGEKIKIPNLLKLDAYLASNPNKFGPVIIKIYEDIDRRVELAATKELIAK